MGISPCNFQSPYETNFSDILSVYHITKINENTAQYYYSSITILAIIMLSIVKVLLSWQSY